MTIGFNADNRTRAFYTPEELATYLGVSKTTVYRLVGRRQIPFHKIGGVLRFRREDIEGFLENGRIEPIDRKIWA